MLFSVGRDQLITVCIGKIQLYLHQFIGVDLVTVIIDELLGIHPAYQFPCIVI